MKNILELIKSRRCVRSFNSSKKISREQIEKILEAGQWAPSAGNAQDWQFLVVQNEKTKKRLADAALGQDFIAEASVVIVVVTDLKRIEEFYGSRGRGLYSLQDTAAATQNMFLTAHSMGLGACWVGAFNEKEVSQVLNLEENLRPVVLLPIGYPKGDIPTVGRRSLEKIVRWIE